MILVTWNCHAGGFRKKAEYIAPLLPDVLVVQEVEPIDSVLLFGGQSQPTCRDRIANPAYPRKGIGVFSYTDTKLNPVDTVDPLYNFRRYEAHRGGLTFHVVGVWQRKTNSAETTYRQAHEGILHHAEWIRQRRTAILGDFNSNGSYRSDNWAKLLELMTPLGLVSAYHTFSGESFGEETRPTHYFRRKEDATFHLDYVFLPETWAQHITKVEVGRYDDWHKISDHVPLVVHLDL